VGGEILSRSPKGLWMRMNARLCYALRFVCVTLLKWKVTDMNADKILSIMGTCFCFGLR
jgi:hypothetical protein